MLERERLESKKISKTNAVTSIMDHELPADDVYIGPSDYVPWLTDRKWAHIRVEGQAFGDVPLNVELKLEVWDSPNSAGIVIDAVRCCKLALNHGIGGQLDGPSSYLMKSPHNQRPDDQARAGHREVHRQVRADSPAHAPEGPQSTGAREGRVGAAERAGPALRAGRARSWPALAAGARRGNLVEPMPEPFSIAHVTPYPWEARGQRGQRARPRASPRELSRARAPRADPRALALAGARARLAPRAARRARRPGARCSPAPTRASRA